MNLKICRSQGFYTYSSKERDFELQVGVKSLPFLRSRCYILSLLKRDIHGYKVLPKYNKKFLQDICIGEAL
jgi:hypothetical protein